VSEPRRTDGPLRLLVVDDDPDYLAMAGLALVAEGFEVMRAAGGIQGLVLAASATPDAILSDYRMPGIDGLMLADAVRRDETLRSTPVVVCSGDARFLARQDRRGLVDAVVAKPADWPRLADLLRACIVTRRAFRGLVSPGVV
jgi:CheY-like chemotaxis protein